MEITAAMVKELRDETGLPMMECRKALAEADGDKAKAKEILRKRGMDMALKRSARTTAQGWIGSYVHFNGRVGVMLELNCETDFVAKGEAFQGLLKELCMHIAMAEPLYVTRDDIPPEVIEKEKAIFAEQVANVPEAAREKALLGKLEKGFFADRVLLEQAYVRDPKVKVSDLLNNVIAKTGENIQIKRFVRYVLGA
ncbi:MAG TPA: elongation factor Ts [Planctomycetes bacterium]|nr:elongation factor Ts [Planctomycetota bacterium]